LANQKRKNFHPSGTSPIYVTCTLLVVRTFSSNSTPFSITRKVLHCHRRSPSVDLEALARHRQLSNMPIATAMNTEQSCGYGLTPTKPSPPILLLSQTYSNYLRETKPTRTASSQPSNAGSKNTPNGFSSLITPTTWRWCTTSCPRED